MNIFKNVDWELTSNIENLQNVGILDQKSRNYYNYVLCKEDTLSNIRKLGEKSLMTELDTLPNFKAFVKSLYYFGKAKGRRDLMHLKDTITAIINWQDRVVKSGGKIYTCIRALLEASGIVIVTAFHDSSHYMAHNREAALIDYVGLNNLTNVYNGSKYGDFSNFNGFLNQKQRLTFD